MADPGDPSNPPKVAPGEVGEEHRCSGCAGPMSLLGPQPIRTGGVPGYPDAVLWLDTFWCPQCGRMAFFTLR